MMSEMKKTPKLSENKMGTMPIGRLLVNMAVPLMISMLVQAMYNVVDSIYVSRISESAVTALSLAFPIQNLLIGFSTGIGVGVNALLSKSLGEGNPDRANHSAGNGFLLVMIATIGFMLFGVFCSRPYFQMQSSVTETVEGGTQYLAICTIFSFGLFVQVLGERLLQATGRSFYSMIVQLVGAVVNILLDPVFIFGYFGIPAMGVAGAAVATVLAQWIAAAVALVINHKCNHEVHLHLKYLKPSMSVIRPILAVGIPSVVMMGIGSVMTFGMNMILQGFTETATSVFGIYFKLQSFFFMPVFGINNATISIIAFNYGARSSKRIMDTLKKSTISACIIMLLGVLCFQFFPDLLLDIFNPTPEFLTMGRSALRIISLSFPLAAVGIALSGSFQALGNGLYSTFTALCRQLLALLPAAYLLSLSGNVNLVWWAFPIAELVSFLATLILFLRLYRQKIKPLDLG